MLQTKRHTFNHNEVDGTGLLCGEENKTIDHILLDSQILQPIRDNVMCDIQER